MGNYGREGSFADPETRRGLDCSSCGVATKDEKVVYLGELHLRPCQALKTIVEPHQYGRGFQVGLPHPCILPYSMDILGIEYIAALSTSLKDLLYAFEPSQSAVALYQ
jgi:hypothetical protein